MKMVRMVSLVLMLAPLGASAGNASSGGGQGVVCRNGAGAIQSAELLDLWEARTLYGAKLSAPKNSIQDTVNFALQALGDSITSDGFAIDIWSQGGNPNAPIQHFQGPAAVVEGMRLNAAVFLDPNSDAVQRLHGVRLALTEDSYEEVMPETCGIEQIVRYDDYSEGFGKILQNQDIVDHMDGLNQAALIVHEAAYKYFRDRFGEPNSLRIRRAVGLAYSGHTFSSLNAKLLPDDYFVCNAGQGESVTRLYVFRLDSKDPNPKTHRQIVIFQLDTLRGSPMIDNGVIQKLPDEGAPLVTSLSDLSGIKGTKEFVYTNGIVQPELRVDALVTSASPRSLSVTVSSKPSVFFPRGVSALDLSCQYHGK